MTQDFYTNNIIGKGENTVLKILQSLTGLSINSLNHFKYSNGIYKQVPISWVIPAKEFKQLSEPHQKGSIDIFIKLYQVKIAIRVQGKGHGSGFKGIGKVRHDKVQAEILKDHCEIVNINNWECKQVFNERFNDQSIKEVIDSFKTSHVMIPSISKI